jgi:hypothetical protein
VVAIDMLGCDILLFNDLDVSCKKFFKFTPFIFEQGIGHLADPVIKTFKESFSIFAIPLPIKKYRNALSKN